MAVILSGTGQEIYVDEADLEWLNCYPWSVSGHGYAVTWIDGKLVYMHRLILGLTDRKVVGDHRDGNGLNNRRSNLRSCTQAENMRNTRKRSDNTSGFKGVSSHHSGRWAARLHVNGKKHWLGLHDTPELAHAAYKSAAAKLHGEFARP